jgi:ribosomal protein S17
MADKKIIKKTITEKKVPVAKKTVTKEVSSKIVKPVAKKTVLKTKSVKKDVLVKKVKTPKKEILDIDKKISHKRRLKAIVLKDNSVAHKFLNVEVTRYVAHPLYKKMIKRKKKYLVSCPQDVDFVLGERVLIEETSPISKRIKFKYISKV